MKTYLNLIVLALMTTITVGCAKFPPRLDSSKLLHYQFKQPARTALTTQQSAHLGKPDKKLAKANEDTYYSANGNLCRRLSNNGTVCYIGGTWFKSASVITTR